MLGGSNITTVLILIGKFRAGRSVRFKYFMVRRFLVKKYYIYVVLALVSFSLAACTETGGVQAGLQASETEGNGVQVNEAEDDNRIVDCRICNPVIVEREFEEHFDDHEEPELPDNLLFKYLYEYWNNWQHHANELWVLQEMYVSEDNPIRFVDLQYIVELIENEETAVVYLGFPSCPWCRVFVPVFLDAARLFHVEEILYRNILEDRNILELRGDEIYQVRAGCYYYYRLMEILGDWTSEYAGLGDPSIRRIFVPAFIFIIEGEIVYLQGYLDSHTERIADDPRRAFQELTESEIKELREIFMYNFSIIYPHFVPCFQPC